MKALLPLRASAWRRGSQPLCSRQAGGMLSRSLSNLIPGSSPFTHHVPIGNGGLYEFMVTAGQWKEAEENHPALICHSTDPPRTITYKELPRRISAAAHALRAKGFSDGDVLNIHLHNCEQFVVAFLAAAALGGTTTTSNPAYTSSELAAQQIDSRARYVLTSKKYEEIVSKATAESGVLNVSYVEDSGCFANAPATNLPIPALTRALSGSDLLTLPYSSGTTGVPIAS